MESPSPTDLIKSIHKEGPKLAINPPPGELAKGDVPGHEFHGNQYTGGGGAGGSQKEGQPSKEAKNGTGPGRISRTTSATDTNGKSLGFRSVLMGRDNAGNPMTVKYGGKEYFATGKKGESFGNKASHAPKGTMMHEMKLSTPKGDVDQRIHVSHDGAYVHED